MSAPTSENLFGASTRGQSLVQQKKNQHKAESFHSQNVFGTESKKQPIKRGVVKQQQDSDEELEITFLHPSQPLPKQKATNLSHSEELFSEKECGMKKGSVAALRTKNTKVKTESLF